MKNNGVGAQELADRCLSNDDLYGYVVMPPGQETHSHVEAHLAECARCQRELSEVLQLLHPTQQDSADATPPISEAEIAGTLTLIQGIGRTESQRRQHRIWLRWAAAAAAALALVAVGAGGLQYYETRRSALFLQKGIAGLERIYTGESPNGLRLDLPFRPAAASRAIPESSAFRDVEVLLAQTIALRPALTEAHLGLAAVYLGESRFAMARAEFQKVLDADQTHWQALIGRGAAAYEEARLTPDPVQRRNLMSAGLADFDAVLNKRPDSSEAHYNRAWVLFENGRHAEALAAIGVYLARDSNSIWAARLRDLQMRIRLMKPDAAKEEVEKAAGKRDASALTALARVAPDRAPSAMRHALKRSLRLEGSPTAGDTPNAADLRWAAENIEADYEIITGDHSWKSLLEFHAGLTPSQRNAKRSLDEKFDALVALHLQGKFQPALVRSASLKSAFAQLGDYWQLFNIHHLRGNCYYYQADFRRAEAEYREMLQIAEQVGAPELRETALEALSASYSDQYRLDELEACIRQIRQLADQHNFDAWKMFAAEASGSLHRRLNQFDASMKDYAAALRFAYRNRDTERLGNLLENIVLILDRLERPAEARSLLGEAVDWMGIYEKEAAPSKSTEVALIRLNLLCRQGEASLCLGNLDQAESCFRQVLSARAGPMRELECRARLGLAEVCLGKKRPSEAKLLLEEGGAQAVSGGYAELQWQARCLEGRLRRDAGDMKGAQTAFAQAIAALEGLRDRIKSWDLRKQFLTRRFDPYNEIVSLLCSALGDGRAAQEFAGRAKSITLREYLEAADQIPAEQHPDIPGALRALFVDYFFSANELLAFVSGPGSAGPKVASLGLSRAYLDLTVRQYLDSIRTGDGANFHALSRKLFEGLIAPVFRLAANESYEGLVIFPDGPLHALPFGGLKDPQGRFLLETRMLSYAPSQTVLQHCLSMGRGGANSRSRLMVVLDGTAGLPGAQAELALVSKVYEGTCRFLDAGNWNSARRAAAEAEILHFAGHAAVVNGKPALMLKSGSRPVYVEAGDIGLWRLTRNRLVTLAGCETGIGPQAEGEIPWGLIPAFLNAGAPALIVSLLPVDDAASARLTARFYELLANGAVSKAKALQQAQLSLLNSSRTTALLNPATWLPFVLIGDPR